MSTFETQLLERSRPAKSELAKLQQSRVYDLLMRVPLLLW
jgi:hypothetical protein